MIINHILKGAPTGNSVLSGTTAGRFVPVGALKKPGVPLFWVLSGRGTLEAQGESYNLMHGNQSFDRDAHIGLTVSRRLLTMTAI